MQFLYEGKGLYEGLNFDNKIDVQSGRKFKQQIIKSTRILKFTLERSNFSVAVVVFLDVAVAVAALDAAVAAAVAALDAVVVDLDVAVDALASGLHAFVLFLHDVP